MKTNLLKSFLILAIMFLPFLASAQTTVYEIAAPAEDGYVSHPDSIATNNPYLWNEMKLGRSAVDGSAHLTACIIPFQLPERPAGKLVVSASLKVYVSYGREWLNSNVDLYALPYKLDSETGREIFTSDYYSGPFVADNGTDFAIEDDYFTKNVDLGNLDTERWEETSVTGNAALLTYINAQYEAGAAAGDWVFLRLSIDNVDMTGSQYFKVTGGDSATPATLTLEVEDADSGTPVWDYEIKAPTEDGYVSDPTIITTNNPYLWDVMKVGKSAVDGSGNTTSGIIPFQLPERPNGESVTNASLKVYVTYGREWANTNIDLYGLPFQADVDNGGTGRVISAADHYSGPFVSDHGTDVAIEDDYFTKNVDLGNLDTERWEETSVTGDGALVDYINAQYDAGAVAGDWVFLRLTVDNPDMNAAHYFKVTGGDSTTPATLSMNISGATKIKRVERGTFNIYPNPVTNGKLRMSFDNIDGADANIQIFTVTGKMVLNRTVSASNSSFEMPIDLTPGLYIIKLNDGMTSKTQKLIVK